MQVYFVAVEKPVSVDDILSFLERERIRCHPDAADRFTFDQRGAHYLNKDTGAQFAFLRTGPAGDRLAIHLSIPPLAPAFFAREAADELDALTKELPIDLAESGAFDRARFLALHSDLHWAAHVRCAARKESRPSLSESTLDAVWSWNTKFDAACEWVSRNTEISEPTLAFVSAVLHPDGSGRVATAVRWRDHALVPNADYLFFTHAGETRSVEMKAIGDLLGDEHSVDAFELDDDEELEFGLDHWLLGDDERERLAKELPTRATGPALEIVPWLKIATQELLTDAAVVPMFEAVARGTVDPTFGLVWTNLHANRTRVTSIWADGSVRSAVGRTALPPREHPILGWARPSDIARIGEALVRSRFPRPKTVRIYDGVVAPAAVSCVAFGLGHAANFALETDLESDDFDHLRSVVWSVFEGAEERRAPDAAASPYGTCGDAVNAFLAERSHAWRVVPERMGGGRPFDAGRTVTLPVDPPAAHVLKIPPPVSHHLTIDWASRRLAITESEDKGMFHVDVLAEPIDDVWFARFASLAWP